MVVLVVKIILRLVSVNSLLLYFVNFAYFILSIINLSLPRSLISEILNLLFFKMFFFCILFCNVTRYFIISSLFKECSIILLTGTLPRHDCVLWDGMNGGISI